MSESIELGPNLMDMPPEVLDLVVASMDPPSLDATRATCHALHALCEERRELRIRRWAANKYEYSLEQHLKRACTIGCASVAKHVLERLKGLVTYDHEPVVKTREWYRVQSFNRMVHDLLPEAVHLGHAGIVKLLIGFGSDPNRSLFISSLLHIACARGHVTVVRALLEAGVDAKATDLYGQSPMEIAQQCGHPDVARALAESKSTVKQSP